MLDNIVAFIVILSVAFFCHSCYGYTKEKHDRHERIEEAQKMVDSFSPDEKLEFEEAFKDLYLSGNLPLEQMNDMNK